MRRLLLLGIVVIGMTGCQTYRYAAKVDLISFDDEIHRGKSVGSIEGRDCVWKVFGRWLGSSPTLDSAFRKASTQSKSNLVNDTAGQFGGEADGKMGAVRYMNDVRSEWDGFDAWIIGNRCLVVKGRGYK